MTGTPCPERKKNMADEEKSSADRGKARTITLSNHAPVRIHEAEWPILSFTRDEETEGQESSRWWLTVRRHKDGRCIVYARFEVTREDRAAPDKLVGGELLSKGENVAAAVRRVGEECHCTTVMIARCIAGLPAEEI